MNPQTTQPTQALTQNPGHPLDRILSALRDTPAPTGMNQRIAARIAQAQTESQRSSLAARSWRSLAGQLSPTHRYALTALTLVALALATLHVRQSTLAPPRTTAAVHSNPSTPASDSNSLAPATTVESLTPATAMESLAPATAMESLAPATTMESLAPASTLSTASHLRAGGPPYTSVGRSPTYAPTTPRGPEARSIPSTPASTDPDTLALAETLAPSHPAPPMPLTAQEHLLLLATRQGQPMELAELESLRQPALQAAAEAHQNATIRRYAESLLRPLAAAEALNPASPPPTPDDTPTTQPPSSK